MCFANRPESVRLARRFVELAADAYGITHVAESAALLVSELATNATQHARADSHVFNVAVSRCGNRMRVEVRDQNPRLPVMCYVDALDEGGRGLYLVAELADDCGAFRLPGGKAVWFELVAWYEPVSDIA